MLRGAVFDAQSAPATITVGRNVFGQPRSMVGLGCQPPEYTGNSAHPCETQPDGRSTIVVKGDVTLLKPIGVFLNGIDRNVILAGITLTGADDESGSGTNSLFVVRNSIGRNIACFGLTPGVFGYGNTISHHALGQCASLADG